LPVGFGSWARCLELSRAGLLINGLPAGAIAGWALHPLEKRRLVTAHVENGHSRPAAQLRSEHHPAGEDVAARRYSI